MSINKHISNLYFRCVVYKSASNKSQITVLAYMSASAHYLLPFVVYPGQKFSEIMLEGFGEAVLGRSKNV